mgnify:CR=1 FL=1
MWWRRKERHKKARAYDFACERIWLPCLACARFSSRGVRLSGPVLGGILGWRSAKKRKRNARFRGLRKHVKGCWCGKGPFGYWHKVRWQQMEERKKPSSNDYVRELLQRNKGAASKQLLKLLQELPGFEGTGEKEIPIITENLSSVSIIHLAASEGKLELLKLLLKHNRTEVDETDANNFTPLHCACRNSSYKAVRFLLKKGADPFLTTNAGCTAVHLLCSASRHLLPRTNTGPLANRSDPNVQILKVRWPDNIFFSPSSRFCSHRSL